MADPEFSFTPNANPVIELGLGDTRIPSGTGVWDSALWDDSGAVWQGDEPAWWDVSCFAIEADIARGRERATDRFVPGTAGIVLSNADGWADMAGTPGQIAAVSLRPGRAVRVGVDVHSIGVVWLFRGVIDKVTPTYDPVHLDYVKLDCIDLLGEVGHVKLVQSAPVGGDDTVTERMNRILDACQHPAEKREIATDTLRLIQTSYGAQAVDLLGVAADSAGGIVYGDEAGNVCYKGFGWQNYDAGEGNDGSIGNVVAPIPGVPAFTPEPYLDTAGAPVTTPDAPSLTLTNGFTVFATVRHPTGATGTSFLAGQWASGQREWKIERDRASGTWSLVTSSDGTASTSAPFTTTPTAPTAPTGADETWALSVILDDGFGQSVLQAYRRQGGDDLNPLWFAAGPPNVVAELPWVNRTSAVSIGTATGLTGQTWPGRIYDVTLADAATVNPPGAVLWRFDVSDTIAGTTSWTDPRGRVWTVGGAAAGHVHPPTIPAVPGTVGDICPAAWEVSYDRMDLATGVELNRVLPSPVPRLRFNLGTAVGASAGQLNLNNSDQTAATVMSVSFTTADGTDSAPFVRNLSVGAEVRLSDVGDVTNNTRQYRVTGAATFNTTNYLVPIAWVEGLTAIGGVIDMAATFTPPIPYVVNDISGQALYGTEVFELTDLISINGDRFPALATRALATRGYTAMPRLEAVLLDAKASRGEMAALELMAQCRPEEPSRYTCRLRMEDGRIVFDRNMFAVGTQHHIERSEWTLRIALDDAAWASTPYGTIVASEIPDTAAITGTVS